MPVDSSKPDLGSLRIHDGQRAKSGMGKRVVYASIPVLVFGAIVATAFALRSQKPVVEVTTAAKPDRKSTRLNSSHLVISYAVFCLKKKKKKHMSESHMTQHNTRYH